MFESSYNNNSTNLPRLQIRSIGNRRKPSTRIAN
jgi:hypothetical protein